METRQTTTATPDNSTSESGTGKNNTTPEDAGNAAALTVQVGNG